MKNKEVEKEDCTLNILNGQSMFDYFYENNMMGNGLYIPFNEAMCVGKLIEDIFSPKFIDSRLKALSTDYESYNLKVLHYIKEIGNEKYKEIVLWFDYDMFCQINVLVILAYLDILKYKGKVILHLVDYEDKYKIIKEYPIIISGYNEIYKEALVENKNNRVTNIIEIDKGIKLYLDYLKNKNEITDFIEENIEKSDYELVCELIRRLPQYGLGDTQYFSIIEKCRNE